MYFEMYPVFLIIIKSLLILITERNDLTIFVIRSSHADPGSILDSTTFKKSLSIAYISFIFCYFLISFYIFNFLDILSLSIDDEDRLSTQECIC